MKSQLFILILFSTFILNISYGQEAKKYDCADLTGQLTARQSNLEKLNQSLDYLLGTGGKPELSLSVLFQVDLGDPDSINKRKIELADESLPEKVLLTQEFENYLTCTPSTDDKIQINKLAQNIALTNNKKLKYLVLDEQKRATLLNTYKSERKQIEKNLKLDSTLYNSQEALIAAQNQLRDNEALALSEKDTQISAILATTGLLKKSIVDTETEQVDFIEKIKEKNDQLTVNYIELIKAIKDIELTSKVNISESYSIIVNIWREAADSLLVLYKGLNIDLESEIPVFEKFTSIGNEEKKYYDQYIQTYNQYIAHRKNLLESRINLINELKAQNFQLLNEAGHYRAKFMKRCDELKCQRSRGLTEANIIDFQREIKIVPLKLVARGLSKWLEVKSKVNSGLDTQIDLFKQILLLIGALISPFILLKLLNIGTTKLDQLRKDLLSKSIMDYKNRTRLAIWISRINPFVPYIGMFLATIAARFFIEGTDLSELSNVLIYLQFYFVFRIFRLLLSITFEVVFTGTSISQLKDLKLKIEKTSSKISRLIFLEFVLLHLTEDAVRKALAYQIFSSIIYSLNILVIYYVTFSWKIEILSAFQERFPKLTLKYNTLLTSWWNFIFLPFELLAILVSDLYDVISKYLAQTDIIKKLSSEILRLKLERVDKEDAVAVIPPPAEYLKQFDYYLAANDSIFVDRPDSIITELVTISQKWLNNKGTDDLVIIVGNRGMGKTTILAAINLRLQGKAQTQLTLVPPRTTSFEMLFAWLSDFLKTPITQFDDIVEFDKKLDHKMVLIVDDIHNLFLATNGGFEAYRLFLEIVSLKSKNLLWILSVNSRSWSYLKGVFGEEHSYGKILNLKPWKENEIQKLIMERHRLTGLNRTFDNSIKAYGAGDALGAKAEAQFFRLLWGQSRGNPRSALMYWISAISHPTNDTIHVGIPSFFNSAQVATLSDEALFILAALARHDNLTHRELKKVTNIADLVIRKCLKEAEDKSLTWTDANGRVRISSRAQYVIDYFLTGKNFIYE